MKLPFLPESRWPTSKETEEKVVNPSYDTQIQDHLVGEILIARENKDHKKMGESIRALVRAIQNEEQDADMAG